MNTHEPILSDASGEEVLNSDKSYRRYLLEQLEDRKRKSASFSLRAFARKLGLSPSSVSLILSGKRRLSLKSAEQIAERLNLSPAERQLLLRSVTAELFKGLRGQFIFDESENAVQVLELDTFKLIADWYHYAILNLVETKGCKVQHEWFARRLNISPVQAQHAIERLIRLGLLKKEGKKFTRIDRSLDTPNGIPSTAIRKYHEQVLDKAKESIERDAPEARDFGAMTMAIDPSLIPKARSILLLAQKQVSQLLSTGEKKRVYILATHLFPVDVQEEKAHEK